MNEEWRPVVGWEGLYEVSSHGRVRSLDRYTRTRNPNKKRLHRGVTLTPGVHISGHLSVCLSREGDVKQVSVHVLVLEAFKGLRPDKMEACHGNGDPADNRIENLRWDTSSSNHLDKVRHGKHHHANKTHCPQGHEYSKENTYTWPTGGRKCRKCANAKEKLRRERGKN